MRKVVIGFDKCAPPQTQPYSDQEKQHFKKALIATVSNEERKKASSRSFLISCRKYTEIQSGQLKLFCKELDLLPCPQLLQSFWKPCLLPRKYTYRSL